MTAAVEERAPKPYGDVAYADPKNGKYPIDTEAHIRAAWAYINMPKNAAVYPLNGVTLDSVKSKIQAAMKGIGAGAGGQSAANRAALELRRRHRLSMVSIRERRGLSFNAGLVEVRAAPDGTGGTKFEFEGYGSVFDSPFGMWDKWGEPYTEVVKQGAFTESLGRPDLDVPFLIGHNDAGIPLARTRAGTMRLSQDPHGLHVLADMDGARSDVRDLASAVERGDLDEMSIGFITRGQEWDENYENRSMLDLDIHRGDVSAVALGASAATAGSTMTALPVSHLSRHDPAAEAAAAGGPGETLMMKGTKLRLPMIDAALDQAQAIFAKQDLSKMDPDMAQAVELVGSAGIHVDHILKHEGLPDPDNGAASNWSAGDPAAEARSNAIDTNLGDAPDYNPGPKVVPPLTCPQCGASLGAAKKQKKQKQGKNAGGGDTLIRLDDAGIPTDEAPSSLMSLSLEREALERRSRELALLALAG